MANSEPRFGGFNKEGIRLGFLMRTEWDSAVYWVENDFGPDHPVSELREGEPFDLVLEEGFDTKIRFYVKSRAFQWYLDRSKALIDIRLRPENPEQDAVLVDKKTFDMIKERTNRVTGVSIPPRKYPKLPRIAEERLVDLKTALGLAREIATDMEAGGESDSFTAKALVRLAQELECERTNSR